MLLLMTTICVVKGISHCCFLSWVLFGMGWGVRVWPYLGARASTWRLDACSVHSKLVQ